MKDNFPACLDVVLRYEGGKVDNAHDPGGRTNKGVTQRVYTAYRASCGLPLISVYDMSQSECQSIYNRQYWGSIHGDDLPAGLDLALFDYAVNSGAIKAVKALQSALGTTADGQYGIVTARAVQRIGSVPRVITAVCEGRLSFLHRLTSFRYFGRGWSARVRGVQSKALAMAAHAG